MQIKKTLATDASQPYSWGDAIGSLVTIATSQLEPPTEWRLNSVLVKDYSGRNPGGELIFFDSYPTTTSVTNNQPCTIPQQNDGARICAQYSVLSNAFVNVSGMGLQTVNCGDIEIPANPAYCIMRGYTSVAMGSTSAIDLLFQFNK